MEAAAPHWDLTHRAKASHVAEELPHLSCGVFSAPSENGFLEWLGQTSAGLWFMDSDE
jgi:hypothetical protein